MKSVIAYAVALLFAATLHAQTLVTLSPGTDVASAVSALAGAPAVFHLATPGIYPTATTIHLKTDQVLICGPLATLRWMGTTNATEHVVSITGTVGPSVGTLTANTGKPVVISTSHVGRVRISYDWEPAIPQHEDNEVVSTATGNKLLRRPSMYYPNGATLSSFSPAANTIVQGVRIEAAGANAAIFMDGTADVTIRDVSTTGGKYGVFATNSYRPTIAASRFELASSAGIRIERSTAGTIRDSTIINSWLTGIFLGYGSWNWQVEGNSIHGSGVTKADGNVSGGDGITVSGAGNLAFINNRIMGVNCYGMWFVRAIDRVLILGNTIVGGVTAALLVNNTGLDTTRSFIVAGNTFDANDGGGMGMVPGMGVILTNNIFDTRKLPGYSIGAGSVGVVIGDNIEQ